MSIYTYYYTYNSMSQAWVFLPAHPLDFTPEVESRREVLPLDHALSGEVVDGHSLS